MPRALADYSVLQKLQVLGVRFAVIADTDRLAVHCAVGAFQAWLADVNNGTMLSHSMQYLDLCRNPQQQGRVAFGFWRYELRKRLAHLVSLLEKVGRSLADAVCTKHFQMTLSAVKTFVLNTLHVLTVLERVVRAERAAPAAADDAGSGSTRSSASSPSQSPERRSARGNADAPLTAESLLALRPELSLDRVSLHAHLCRVVHLTLCGQLKGVYPIALFEPAVAAKFFAPLDAPEQAELVEAADDASRTELLLKRKDFVHKCLRFVPPLEVAEPGWETLPHLLILIDVFADVRDDPFNLALACRLYDHGFYREAEEAMLLVDDRELIGPALLQVVRRMLQYLLEHDQDQVWAPQLPADVFDWCCGSETGADGEADAPAAKAPARAAPPALKLLQTLARRAAAETDRAHSDSARATQLADVVAKLKAAE